MRIFGLYKSCVCRNTLIDKLHEECTNDITENKIYNETLNETSSNDCASRTLYVVLFAVFLTTSVIIRIAFIYFYFYKNNQSDSKNNVGIKYNPSTQTTIY